MQCHHKFHSLAGLGAGSLNGSREREGGGGGLSWAQTTLLPSTRPSEGASVGQTGYVGGGGGMAPGLPPKLERHSRWNINTWAQGGGKRSDGQVLVGTSGFGAVVACREGAPPACPILAGSSLPRRAAASETWIAWWSESARALELPRLGLVFRLRWAVTSPRPESPVYNAVNPTYLQCHHAIDWIADHGSLSQPQKASSISRGNGSCRYVSC